MREFSVEYLRDTRHGMWDDRAALAGLDLAGRDRVLDVGCGVGSLTDVIRAESDAVVVGLDADASLLPHVEADDSVVGDALALPFVEGSFDLVVCQALLVNLRDPTAAIRQFARVSSDLVAVVEPDNADVTIGSSVAAEPRLARQARTAYLAEHETDPTLGAEAAGAFREAGLSAIETRRYDHTQTVEPPYSTRALKAAHRKARATRLDELREGLLGDELTESGFDTLRREWRSMGRTVVDQMRAGDYERRETVPFYVTVGQVRDGHERA